MMNKYILILSLLVASISTMAQMKDRSVYENICYMKAIEYIDTVDLDTTKTKKHISEEILKDSIDNKATITSEPKMTEPFHSGCQQMPSFPGGQEAMMQFISDNLVYPDSAKQAGLQGRVTLRFIVEPDGSLSDITVVRGIDKECDEEALRIVKLMPRWEPGKGRGTESGIYFTLPIVFRLKKETITDNPSL